MRKRREQIAKNLFGQKALMEKPEQREFMALALRLSSDKRMKALADQAMSPSFDHSSFATLADNLGLGFMDLEREIRALMKSEGYIRAARHLPDLMEQSAQDARSKWETCPECHGEDQEEICKVCHGKKTVYVPGEIDRLKLVFDTFGLIGKGGIAVNLDLRRVDESERLEDLAQSVAPILEGKVGE